MGNIVRKKISGQRKLLIGMMLTPLLLIGKKFNEDQDEKGTVENNVCKVHPLLCQTRDQEFNIHRRCD